MLKDLRVVETAAVLAGPAVGMFFAELGAQVVKIENKRAGGDITRKWKLPGEDHNSPVSAYFSSVNWGKEHRFLDLSDATDRKAFDALVAEADVLVTNHLADDAAKLGLQPERLRALNPKLVHGHIRGYAGEAHAARVRRGVAGRDGLPQQHDRYRHGPPGQAAHRDDRRAGGAPAEGRPPAGPAPARAHRPRGHVEVALEEAALTGLINQACNWLMAHQVARPSARCTEHRALRRRSVHLRRRRTARARGGYQ